MSLKVKRVYLPVFQWYKQRFGNLLIKPDFQIPSNEEIRIPKEFYKSNNLGNYVDIIRQQMRGKSRIKTLFHQEDIDELLEMGLIPNMAAVKEPTRQQRIVQGVTEYKQKNGHCDISSTFQIDENDTAWSEEARGLNLGKTIGRMRGSRKHHKPIHNQLTELGVELSPLRSFEKVYDALVAYKNVHSNLDIPQKFIVPKGDQSFPKHTWGLKLGSALQGIRTNETWQQHKETLVALGVDFTVIKHRSVGFEVIYSALDHYLKVNGDVLVPRDFIVPINTSDYPESTWGMKLGHNLHNIRVKDAWIEHRYCC